MNLYQRRRAEGLCGYCGQRAPSMGRSTCGACAIKRRAYELRRRRKEGLSGHRCAECGVDTGGGNAQLCEEHAAGRVERNRVVYAKRRQAGMCVTCGVRHRNGWSSCDECNAKARARRRRLSKRRLSQGLCERCTDPVAPGRQRCAGCLSDASEKGKARHREKVGGEPRPALCSKCYQPGHNVRTCGRELEPA